MMRKDLIIMSGFIKNIKFWIIKNLSIILFVALWEIAPRIGLIKATFVAPPSVILKTFITLYQNNNLFTHIEISLQRSILGFFLAGLVGIPLGFLLGGWFKTIERILNPVLRLLGQFNPFSLFPVFMLLFGIGEVSKVAIIFWVCIWPILYNTITGVKELDPTIVKLARSMGSNKVVLFLKVVLPSSAPSIFTGLKMSSGTAFFMLIAAEMIGASSGLGWLVWNAQVNFQIPNLYAATVLIAVLGVIINNLIKLTEKKVVVWKDKTVY